MKIIEVLDKDVRRCNRCGEEIAFLQSKRGKWYPVNVDYAVAGARATFKTNFHRCVGSPVATREEQQARYLDCGPQNWDDR